MTLTEMRQVLTERGIQLTRSLGQSFLHDRNQLQRIVSVAAVAPGDRVLEIGPGLGPLTEELLKRGARVLAVEKDSRLVEVLRDRFPSRPAPTSAGEEEAGFELILADALRWLEKVQRDWRGWKVVSNLPYSVASPILVDLALSLHPPDRMVVTLQREVGERLVAGPGGRDYGILSLLVSQRYAARLCFGIPRDCFFPAPDVDSVCVCLERRADEWLNEAERTVFGRVVKRAFSERRKKALKLLKHDWPAPPLDAAWRDLGLDEQVRAERIGLDHFVELAVRLARAETDPPRG
ncbi:MAG: ribosomal RNA small subunit methyltransferase A [Verrucomicrobia bacterium]|nr:ribosomal RNA small subunit methyltransferase A [Verrucomicrobiota bacterium]